MESFNRSGPFCGHMKLMPAISIKQRRVAIVEDGHYEFLKNREGQFRKPTNLLQELKSDTIYVLDIDGLERSSPNMATIKNMAAFKDIWLDAGTQDIEDMMDLFVNDASEVVFGTKTLTSLEELEEAAELSERIIFSLDYNDEILSPNKEISKMSLDELCSRVSGFKGLDTAILMDLGSIKDGTPADLGMIRAMANHFQTLFVSAHVVADDLDAIEGAGAAGMIVDFRTLKELGGQ